MPREEAEKPKFEHEAGSAAELLSEVESVGDKLRELDSAELTAEQMLEKVTDPAAKEKFARALRFLKERKENRKASAQRTAEAMLEKLNRGEFKDETPAADKPN